MTKQHTPGPWKVRGQAGYTGNGVNDSTGRSVCSVPSNGNRDHAERNANVALLAAAPDMLAALLEIIDVAGPSFGLDDGPGTINRMAYAARTAINKLIGG